VVCPEGRDGRSIDAGDEDDVIRIIAGEGSVDPGRGRDRVRFVGDRLRDDD